MIITPSPEVQAVRSAAVDSQVAAGRVGAGCLAVLQQLARFVGQAESASKPETTEQGDRKQAWGCK